MSPKLGQKIKDNPKDIMIRTRIDKETMEKLEFAAGRFGISKAEVVRNGIESEYQKAKKI